ncbi:MAG: hypothetical protein KGZ79_16105, partial [Dethiobacter sp.]|nr:hypothetical protein [Dethiobacter sp.]
QAVEKLRITLSLRNPGILNVLHIRLRCRGSLLRVLLVFEQPVFLNNLGRIERCAFFVVKEIISYLLTFFP